MIERRVARHAQDPCGERDLPLLVLLDRPHQLREHLMGDVLGVVAVLNDALNESKYVIRVAGVEIVQRVPITALGRSDRPTLKIDDRVLSAGRCAAARPAAPSSSLGSHGVASSFAGPL